MIDIESLAASLCGLSRHSISAILTPIFQEHADQIDKIAEAAADAYDTGVKDAREQHHRYLTTDPVRRALKRRSELVPSPVEVEPHVCERGKGSHCRHCEDRFECTI